MKTRAPNSDAGSYYTAPTPERAYLLSVTHGVDAVVARWWAFPEREVRQWLRDGQASLLGRVAKSRRRSPEERRKIVAAVFEHGSPSAAARALKLSLNTVGGVLVTEGVRDYPRLTFAERAACARASRRYEARP